MTITKKMIEDIVDLKKLIADIRPVLMYARRHRAYEAALAEKPTAELRAIDVLIERVEKVFE